MTPTVKLAGIHLFLLLAVPISLSLATALSTAPVTIGGTRRSEGVTIQALGGQ